MLKFLKKLNTSLNLFKSLESKVTWLKKWFKKIFLFFKKRKKLSFVLAILLLIIGFKVFQNLRPKSPQELYQLTTVKNRDITQTIIASGTIVSQTQVDLKFQTAGQINWVGVKEGDYVKKWQAIASLDTRELKKNLELELRDYSKQRNDFEEDRLETYQDADLTNTIKRILQKNQWDLEKAVLDVEIDDITLKYATLISPMDGIITHIDVPVAGINITAAKAVFTVADPENLTFEAEIDEADVGLLNTNQKAQLLLDAYPDEPIAVIVDSINFASSTDSSGSTVYIAKFQLLNSSLNRYRLGMNGEVIVTVAQKQNVLTIPTDALIEDDTIQVRVVEGKLVTNQTVTTGVINDDYVEITSGLKENQTITVSLKLKKK